LNVDMYDEVVYMIWIFHFHFWTKNKLYGFCFWTPHNAIDAGFWFAAIVISWDYMQ
jgi:hypothetical protein